VALLIRRLPTSHTIFEKLLRFYNIPPIVGTTATDLTTDLLMQVARKCGRPGKGGIPGMGAAAKVFKMDWRDGRSQGWFDPPNCGPYDYQGVKPATAAIILKKSERDCYGVG